MRRRLGRLSRMFVAAPLLAIGLACPRYAMVRPPARFLVEDGASRPISGARITFVAASHPHHVFHSKRVVQTDEAGTAAFAAAWEHERVYPFLIHGVPFYYWLWCVEKEGYGAAVGEARGPEWDTPIRVRLAEAEEAASCEEEGGFEWRILEPPR